MAVELFTLDQANQSQFGLWKSALALRHNVLVMQQGWDVFSRKGLEFDEYDNPYALNICQLSRDGDVQGYCRLNPTMKPFLLKDVFPFLSTDPIEPRADSYESTRAVLSPSVRGPDRTRVIGEMMAAAMLFMCRSVGLKRIYFVTEKPLVPHLMGPFDLDITFFEPQQDPGNLIAGYYGASVEQAHLIAEKHQLDIGRWATEEKLRA